MSILFTDDDDDDDDDDRRSIHIDQLVYTVGIAK
jgi:hypothetical protein